LAAEKSENVADTHSDISLVNIALQIFLERAEKSGIKLEAVPKSYVHTEAVALNVAVIFAKQNLHK